MQTHVKTTWPRSTMRCLHMFFCSRWGPVLRFESRKFNFAQTVTWAADKMFCPARDQRTESSLQQTFFKVPWQSQNIRLRLAYPFRVARLFYGLIGGTFHKNPSINNRFCGDHIVLVIDHSHKKAAAMCVGSWFLVVSWNDGWCWTTTWPNVGALPKLCCAVAAAGCVKTRLAEHWRRIGVKIHHHGGRGNHGHDNNVRCGCNWLSHSFK